MAKSPIDGRRAPLAVGRVRGIAVAVTAACLATAHLVAVADTKPGADSAALPVPLCTAGTVSAKAGEDALGLYAIGGGQHMVEWTDAENAKNCEKGTLGGLRLQVDDVSLGLAKIGQTPIVVYNFSAGGRQVHVSLQEPAICESYATDNTPLRLSIDDTNDDGLLFYGVESLRYSLASGALAPVLTQAEYGPYLRCHAVTAANAPLPDDNSLFNGNFESTSDLRVEFLDAQGVVLDATGNDQFVNQPVAFADGITYQVRITNTGEGPATGIRVREFAPLNEGTISPKATLSGCGPNPTGSAPYCVGGTGLLQDDIPTLNPGASQVYSLTRKALTSGAITSVAAFSNPNTTAERKVADNARSLRINLINNQPPQAVGSIANVAVAEGESLNIATAANFLDPEGATLSYSAGGLPPGTSINAGSGVITGLLGFMTHGEYDIVVTANDGSLSVNQAFTLTVIDANGAPLVAAALPDVMRSEGQQLEIATAQGFSDPDSDLLSYSVTGLPAEYANFYSSATGNIFVPQLSSTSAGIYEVTVTASDGELTAQQTFTLTILNVNAAPTVAQAIADQDSDEGEAISLDVSSNFVDTDQDDTLTFSVSAGALPPGLSLSAAGLISGDISHTGFGSYAVTITADDGNGGTVSAPSFDWDVAQVNVAPVAVGSIAPQSGTEGDNFATNGEVEIEPAFFDPDGDDLTYSVAGLPAGLSMPFGMFGNPSITGIPGPGTAGEYEVTVTAEDAGGLTVDQVFTLTIDPPP